MWRCILPIYRSFIIPNESVVFCSNYFLHSFLCQVTIKTDIHAPFICCIAGVPDKKQLRLEVIEDQPQNVRQQVSDVSIVCDGPPAKVHLV